MNPRFYVDPAAIERPDEEPGGQDVIPFRAIVVGGEAHHAVRVLRLRAGDRLVLLDGSGDEYAGVIERIVEGADGPALNVTGESIRRSPAEPPFDVVLVQGLPKSDKLEWIVEKGTEVGVTHFLPVRTERTVVEYTAPKADRKRSRCERVAAGAAKQARRGRIPTVFPFESLKDALSHGQLAGLTWIAFWEEAATSLKSVADRLRSERLPEHRGYALFIGPEGGFSPEEAALLAKNGAHVVSLGPRILRTETAGAVATALVLFMLEDLSPAR